MLAGVLGSREAGRGCPQGDSKRSNRVATNIALDRPSFYITYLQKISSVLSMTTADTKGNLRSANQMQSSSADKTVALQVGVGCMSFSEEVSRTRFSEEVSRTSFFEEVSCSSFSEEVSRMSLSEEVSRTRFSEEVSRTRFS